MLGPEYVAAKIGEVLAARVPVVLQVMRERYDVDEYALPDPARVFTYDPGALPIEDWPGLVVLVRGDEAVGKSGTYVTDEGVQAWLVGYQVRVQSWVRGVGDADVDVRRKRYALTVREALLGSSGIDSVDGMQIDTRTFKGVYTELMSDGTADTIAGSWVDFAVVVEETVDGQIVGVLDTVAVTGTNVGALLGF